MRVEPLSADLERWKAPTSAVTRSTNTHQSERQTDLVVEQIKLCQRPSNAPTLQVTAQRATAGRSAGPTPFRGCGCPSKASKKLKSAGEIDPAAISKGSGPFRLAAEALTGRVTQAFPAPRRPRHWRQFALGETTGEAVAVDSPYRPDPDDLAGGAVSNLSALASLLLPPCFGSKSALLGVANVCECVA
jgi:hypothetical protein